MDFVLPESLDQAFKFAEEFCAMGKEEAWETAEDGERVYVQPADRQHTDKLQAELSMCLAAKHAVQVLSGTLPGQLCSHVNVCVCVSVCVCELVKVADLLLMDTQQTHNQFVKLCMKLCRHSLNVITTK